jgi:FMN phosphatase YigB (HAD superfamily)
MFSAILFDLDGTLLEVEMRSFIRNYVAGYYACCSDLIALDPLQRAMRAGIQLLLETEDGTRSNEERLFAFLALRLQLAEGVLRERYLDYLASDFSDLKRAVRPIPAVFALLDFCRQADVPLALATNPVFPRALVEARCHWGGISTADFAVLTCFENSYYCKPQAGYFLEVSDKLGFEPGRCLMVGNDTNHDLAAAQVGMTTWLIEDYLVERDGPGWAADYRGTHHQLLNYLQKHF